ncbi:MAG: hypothetical protein JHC95_01955 [Solirubrobacteraceae bacterium]|nr:hypothetical protein [Solirubrobacteraceae bacterium]
MGFQLGPKFLRKQPKGWLPARAYPVKHATYEHHNNDPEGGESVIETSAGLTVTWRVELDGREPYEFQEERTGPTWLLSGFTGGGKRWYSVRVRPQYGLMKDVGVPCVVNPENFSELWIDWDTAYDEHVPAWNREARVQRAKAEGESRYDGAFDRIFNPFAGKLRPEDEERLEQAIAEDKSRAAKWLPPEQIAQSKDQVTFKQRLDELGRIKKEGRKVQATVVDIEDTGRKHGEVDVFNLTFELEDGGPPRTVVFEHIYGPRHLKRYKVGKRVDAWVDPLDPEAICPGD